MKPFKFSLFFAFCAALAVACAVPAFAGESVFGKRRATPARAAAAQDDSLEVNAGDSAQLKDIKRNYAAELAAVEERSEELSSKLDRDIVVEFDKWVKAFTKKMKFEEAQEADAIKDAFASSRALPEDGECPPALVKLVRECRKRLAELDAHARHLRAEIGKKYVGLLDKEIRVFATQSDFDSVMRFKKVRDAIAEGMKNASSARGFFSAKTRTADLGKGVKLELVRIPAGSFVMGSPKDEEGRGDNENQVSVTISKPFYLGKYEVTQAQWQTVMGNNPSKHKDNKLPVERVSWNDAVAFCAKLTERERAAKRIPENMKYTLPTEAQWEYACRAGTKTRFYFGNDVRDFVHYGNFGEKKCQSKYHFNWLNPEERKWDDGYTETSPVGIFRPNSWGLYDMHGNVWEWCRDNYSKNLSGGKDPEYVSANSQKVYRGGTWGSPSHRCRSAMRVLADRSTFHEFLGFRVALVEE